MAQSVKYSEEIASFFFFFYISPSNDYVREMKKFSGGYT